VIGFAPRRAQQLRRGRGSSNGRHRRSHALGIRTPPALFQNRADVDFEMIDKAMNLKGKNMRLALAPFFCGNRKKIFRRALDFRCKQA
jgi:hypothetical protein